jgi:hypothetical protein
LVFSPVLEEKVDGVCIGPLAVEVRFDFNFDIVLIFWRVDHPFWKLGMLKFLESRVHENEHSLFFEILDQLPNGIFLNLLNNFLSACAVNQEYQVVTHKAASDDVPHELGISWSLDD